MGGWRGGGLLGLSEVFLRFSKERGGPPLGGLFIFWGKQERVTAKSKGEIQGSFAPLRMTSIFQVG